MSELRDIPPREETAPAVLTNVRDILSDAELDDVKRVELISAAIPDEFRSACLTQPEKEVLAQALSDYSEGVSENAHDYGEEEAEVLAFVEKHVSALERKLLS